MDENDLLKINFTKKLKLKKSCMTLKLRQTYGLNNKTWFSSHFHFIIVQRRQRLLENQGSF